MSNELIGILGVGAALMGAGVALASFIVTGLRGFEQRLGVRMDSLERRMDALETRMEVSFRAHETKMEGALGALETKMEGALGTVEKKLQDRLDLIDNRLGAVERGLAKVEGLIEGMRDALFGYRRAANS